MSDDLFPNPNPAVNRQEMERVVRDIEERTLVGLHGHFNQLVYRFVKRYSHGPAFLV
jgi:hypothetical protein